MINCTKSNLKFNFRVGAIIYNNDKTKILIHQKENFDFWIMPGGKVQNEESSIDAIKRILKDELALDTNTTKMILSIENFFTLSEINYHEIGYYYLVNANFKNIENKKDVFYGSEEKDIFKWVNINELSNYNLLPKPLINKIKTYNEDLTHLIIDER